MFLDIYILTYVLRSKSNFNDWAVQIIYDCWKKISRSDTSATNSIYRSSLDSHVTWSITTLYWFHCIKRRLAVEYLCYICMMAIARWQDSLFYIVAERAENYCCGNYLLKWQKVNKTCPWKKTPRQSKNCPCKSELGESIGVESSTVGIKFAMTDRRPVPALTENE